MTFEENLIQIPNKLSEVMRCEDCGHSDFLNDVGNICRYCLLRKRNPFIQKVWHMQQIAKYTESFLNCSGILFMLFIILLFDICVRCPAVYYDWLYKCEVICCKCNMILAILCCFLYFFIKWYKRVDNITKEQKKLIGIFDINDDEDLEEKLEHNVGLLHSLKQRFNGKGYHESCVCVICATMDMMRGKNKFCEVFTNKAHQKLTVPATGDMSVHNFTASYQFGTSSRGRSRSPNYRSVNVGTPPYGKYAAHHDGGISPLHNRSNRGNNSSFISPYASIHEDMIDNERDLKIYLESTANKFDEIETSNRLENTADSSPNPYLSFWSYFGKSTNSFDAPVYQCAPIIGI